MLRHLIVAVMTAGILGAQSPDEVGLLSLKDTVVKLTGLTKREEALQKALIQQINMNLLHTRLRNELVATTRAC